MPDIPYVLPENTELSDWIPHDGGPCPVPRDARVAVRFRDATERSDLLAAQWDWSRATNAKVGDITHYRVLDTDIPKQPDWIPHDGGECPVPPDTFVQVGHGYVTLGPDRAFKFNWRTVPEYRVIPGEDLLSFGYGEEDDDEPPLVGHNSHNDHYRQGDIECIDAIRAALTDEEWRGFCKGNVLKYTWREKHKGSDGSLLKAQDFLRWAVAGKAEGKR
jgi:hypothetical protein